MLKKNILDNPEKAKKFDVDKKNKVNQSLLVAASIVLVLVSFIFMDNRTENIDEIEEIATIIRANKKGEKRTFRLSDGSSIRLNAESKISFPEKFDAEKREVFLEGEAFFDIERDASRPFIVHSGQITTVVKGTSFNIKAYSSDKDIKVSVATGLVEVINNKGKEKVSLEPKERAVFNLKDKQLNKVLFDYDELAWKDGILHFKNAKLAEVFKVLERWYGVQFRITNQTVFTNNGYTGSFKNEALNTVLETIGFAGEFEFEIKDKQVIIK